MNEPDEVLRVAESIADEVPVNWESQEGAPDNVRSVLSRLRVIETIAAAHRSPAVADQVDSSDTSDLPTAEVRRKVLFLWGHLEVLEKLGEGGFGEVYRAYDTRLDCEVALKLRRGDRGNVISTRRFLDEARRLARVRHPNVLTVHGADEHGGRVGLWTDLLAGRTLEERLKREGTFGEAEAADVGIQICQALAAVHAAGLVHRDVKSSNIMREEGGQYILLDFSSVTERPIEGVSGVDAPVSGTPLYMAPELFEGRDAGTVSDIYSLGVVLYRLLTGRYPVEARKLSELREKHRRGEFVPLRDRRSALQASFLRVVERALSHDPARRYATAGEMESDLRAALGIPAEAPKPRKTSRRLVLGGWLSAAAILVLVLVMFFWPGGLKVEASLYRLGEGVEERLLPGSAVAPGDKLFLEIEGSRTMHVYILNDSADGPVVLFPLSGLDKGNPLEAGATHELPGTVGGAERFFWHVTSAGGRETFLVIASVSPLADLESEISDMPEAKEGVPVQLSPETLEQFRGIHGLTPRPERGDSDISSVKNIAGRSAGDGGIWVWEIHLENRPDE